MAANVETMAFHGDTPWHGLGVPVSGDLTPAEMLVAAGLDWPVEKRQTYFKRADGSFRATPGQFALVRKTDGQFLSAVGSSYIPVQNADAMEFFRQFSEAGDLTMETAGSLSNGRYVWALARMKQDFYVGKGKKDEIRPYLLLSSPHVAGNALILQPTAVRVVCWNTIQAALPNSTHGRLRGDEHSFRLNHANKFDDDAKARAAEFVGLASTQMKEFATAATFLSTKKASHEAVEQFFFTILQYDPVKAAAESKAEPRMLPKLRASLEYGPGANLATAAGTWWGAVNAVTEVIDHELGSDRDKALTSAWFGTRGNLKQTALNTALKLAA